MSQVFRVLLVAASAVLPFSVAAAKPAPAPAAVPTLAHNLDAANEAKLAAVIERFHKETGGEIKLVRLHKGDKPATLNLLGRYQTEDVFSQPKAFVPLYSMMSKAGVALSVQLSEVLKPSVTDGKGRLVALPVLYSTPVMFYNKLAFRKAGLDPEQPPKTWFEMQGYLDKLQSAGYDCPYASSWPTWVHIDNVSAVSGVPAIDAKTGLKFNGLPQVKHVAMMATWSKAHYFRQFGNADEASVRFKEGECAIITTDSREYADFQDARGVELGVAPMPYHDDVYGGRRPTLVGGSSLWVGAGKSAAEYKQAAKFVNYLLSPEIQVELVRNHGGLPLTEAARLASLSRLLQDGRQALEAAYASLRGPGGGPVAQVSRVDDTRLITDEELAAVWADRKPAKAALDTAVTRGNSLLKAHSALKKLQPF